MFSFGRSSSSSVYSRFLAFFSCSGAVGGLFLTSLGGGRLIFFALDLVTPEDLAERTDLALPLDLPLSLEEAFFEEPRLGAIVSVSVCISV